MFRLAHLVGLYHIRQGQYLRDHGLNVAAINKLSDDSQLAGIGLDEYARAADTKFRGIVLIRCTQYRYENPSTLQRLPGPLLSISPNGVEDNIDIRNHILETCFRIVNDFIGAAFTVFSRRIRTFRQAISYGPVPSLML